MASDPPWTHLRSFGLVLCVVGMAIAIGGSNALGALAFIAGVVMFWAGRL